MLNILVSPAGNNPKAEKVAKSIVRFLKEQNEEYSVYFSMNYDLLMEDVRALTNNGEFEFVLIGDDVLAHKFINGIKDLSKIKFGIIPVGDKLDFSRSLGLEMSAIKALKSVLNKKVSKIDYLQVNDKRVLNSVVIGASVETAIAYEQYKLKNFVSKRIAEIRHGEKFDGIYLNLNIKNESPIYADVFELIVANGSYNQDKIISPLSNMSDGLFNVCYSLAVSNKERKEFIKQEKGGNHIYNEELAQLWTNNIKITNQEKKIKTIIDGQYEVNEELIITMIEGGLKIYK